jgi:hypothetical protein
MCDHEGGIDFRLTDRLLKAILASGRKPLGQLRFNGLLVLDDKLLTILMLLQLRPLMRA